MWKKEETKRETQAVQQLKVRLEEMMVNKGCGYEKAAQLLRKRKKGNEQRRRTKETEERRVVRCMRR
jgi:hypothetical protein